MKLKQLGILLIFAYFSSLNLKAQEITMFSGFWGSKYYQDDKQISKKQLEALFKNDKDNYALWQKSKRHITFAWIALGAETGFAVWQLNRLQNNKSQTVPVIGVLSSLAVGVGFTLSSVNLKKKTILAYNEGLDKRTSFKIKVRPTVNGLSLAILF